LFARLLAPLARVTLQPLFYILGKMGAIQLTGKSAVAQVLVRISRFFLNTNKNYPRVIDTTLGRLLKRAFPNVEWEMHHVFVQQAWSKVGGPNQLYNSVAANEGLRRVGNGLWNLLPIPKALNAFLGQNNALGKVATQMFATAYYSIIVYGGEYTA